MIVGKFQKIKGGDVKLECRFKSIDRSNSLVEYAQNRFEKIEKYELKPVTVQVTFSAERQNKSVEVNVQGLNIHYKAISKGFDFYDGVDKALQKLLGQMSKQKNKVQRHKNYAKSHEGRMENINNQLEWVDPVEKAS